MSKSTRKYEYTEGCPNDTIGVLSQQSYKDEKGKLNSAKHGKIEVEHGASDIVLKVVFYDKVIDNKGSIIERKDAPRRIVKAKGNDEQTH